MVKILNCKVKIPKKFEVAVKSIVRIKEQGIYEIVLNEGYEFSFNGHKAIAYDSKQVQDALKAIVMPVPSENVETVLNDAVKSALSVSVEKVSATNLPKNDTKKTVSSFRTSKIINQYINKSGQKVILYAPTGKIIKGNKSVKKSKPKKQKPLKVNVVSREMEEVRFISAFLKGEKTMKQLVSKHSQQLVLDTMKKYNLKSYNYANFKGLSDTKIHATLAFYKRNDLIEMLEKSFVLVA